MTCRECDPAWQRIILLISCSVQLVTPQWHNGTLIAAKYYSSRAFSTNGSAWQLKHGTQAMTATFWWISPSSILPLFQHQGISLGHLGNEPLCVLKIGINNQITFKYNFFSIKIRNLMMVKLISNHAIYYQKVLIYFVLHRFHDMTKLSPIRLAQS